jgi:protein Mpv17
MQSNNTIPRLFMTVAEASLEKNNDLQLPLQERNELQLVLQTSRWDLDANVVINYAILLGMAAFILSKVTLMDSDVYRGWTVVEVAQHMPMGVWNSYTSALHQNPIFTKAVTSASVFAIGDLIAQRSEGKSFEELDRMRALRSLLAGLIGHGPLSHLWYNFCENLFDNVLHWAAWWSVVLKVALDQGFWCPMWNNTYLLLLGLMKRESLSTIWEDVKRTTIPLVVSGLKLMTLTHFVTYGLIPVENRLLWDDFVEIFWVAILATSAAGVVNAHGPAIEEKDTKEAQKATDRSQ